MALFPIRKAKRPADQTRPEARKRPLDLDFESLEARDMMAADLPVAAHAHAESVFRVVDQQQPGAEGIADFGTPTGDGLQDLGTITNVTAPGLPERMDIILDFDGGVLRPGQGYEIVQNAAGQPFAGFDAINGGNREEQIEYILAGVREDFAPFNVNVIWDDRGVESPFFDGVDSVMHFTTDDESLVGLPPFFLFGIAALVDHPTGNGGLPINSFRDTAFMFQGTHELAAGPTTDDILRELIYTTSHEAGHNIGLSHTLINDTTARQVVSIAPNSPLRDGRFSPEVLPTTGPENGNYAEEQRLLETFGPNPFEVNDVPDFDVTSQTLIPLFEPRVGTIGLDATNTGRIDGVVDFFGDQDAYQFTAATDGAVLIVQNATGGSGVLPQFTVTDVDGNVLAVSSDGFGGSADVLFNAVAGTSYFVLAGTTFDSNVVEDAAVAPSLGSYEVVIQGFVEETDFRFAVASEGGRGATSDVQVYDDDGNFLFQVEAFPGIDSRGGTRVAAGDINNDGISDIVAVTGRGVPVQLAAFDGATGASLGGIENIFPVSYEGGAHVAIGDVDGNGFNEIVVTPERDRSDVAVFLGLNLRRLGQFNAGPRSSAGGLTVAVGDVTGNGVEEIIIGSGTGRDDSVRLYSGLGGNLLNEFSPFPETFLGGITVAAGDTNGDLVDEIVVGQGYGGDSRVRVATADGGIVGEFVAYDGFSDFTEVNVGISRRDIVPGLPPGVGTRPDLILTGQGRDSRIPEVRRFLQTGDRFDLIVSGDPDFLLGQEVS